MSTRFAHYNDHREEWQMASVRQYEFIKALADKHSMAPEHRARLEDRLAKRDMTQKVASATITWLKARPLAIRPQVGQFADIYQGRTPVGEGFYVREGVVYRVYNGKYGLICKRLQLFPRHWENAGNDYRLLTEEHRMSAEQAEEMSANVGHCILCGRTLTDPTSVARSIGPVCINKL